MALTNEPPARLEPLDTIEWVRSDTLDPNTYNPNRVARAELALLERSLLTTGWIQPLLITTESVLIDGFHRWSLAMRPGPVQDRWGGWVPVTRLDLSRSEAMMLTVRINRAKGVHVASYMSELVHQLIADGVPEEAIMAGIGANRDEVRLLAQDGVFGILGVADHAYTPAWYPERAKPGQVGDEIHEQEE